MGWGAAVGGALAAAGPVAATVLGGDNKTTTQTEASPEQQALQHFTGRLLLNRFLGVGQEAQPGFQSFKDWRQNGARPFVNPTIRPEEAQIFGLLPGVSNQQLADILYPGQNFRGEALNWMTPEDINKIQAWSQPQNQLQLAKQGSMSPDAVLFGGRDVSTPFIRTPKPEEKGIHKAYKGDLKRMGYKGKEAKTYLMQIYDNLSTRLSRPPTRDEVIQAAGLGGPRDEKGRLIPPAGMGG